MKDHPDETPLLWLENKPERAPEEVDGSLTIKRTFALGQITAFDIADILSSISFLIGSILFYPCFINLGGVESVGRFVAAWLFVVGSVLMLILTIRDLQIVVSALRKLDLVTAAVTISTEGKRKTIIKLLEQSTVKKEEMVNLVLYVASAVLSIMGSIFFLPDLYAESATLGVTLFIAGCLCQITAALWSTGMLLTQGEMKRVKDVMIIFLPFVGSLLFLIGCLFFYPRYQNDAFDTIYATTYFVVGSAMFLLSSLMKIIVLSADFETTEPTFQGREQMILLTRRPRIDR